MTSQPLTRLTGGNDRNDQLYIEALGGSRITLPLVTEITTPASAASEGRAVRLWAEGTPPERAVTLTSRY